MLTEFGLYCSLDTFIGLLNYKTQDDTQNKSNKNALDLIFNGSFKKQIKEFGQNVSSDQISGEQITRIIYLRVK